MRSLRSAFVAACVVSTAPGCAHDPAPGPATNPGATLVSSGGSPALAPACLATWAAPPVIDPSLVPPGPPLRVIAHAAATGTQNYQCGSTAGAFAWSLVGPEATLADCNGAPLGKHFASMSDGGPAGPEWQANDGSFVIGKKVAAVPAKESGAVLWLLVQATSSGGTGSLSGVTYIQRTSTKGGAASSSCDAAHAGSVEKVPYSADYWFFGP